MALIMVVGTYPPNKAEEMWKANISENKPEYPPFVKKVHNWIAQVTTGLYKLYAVYECPEENISEALFAITKRYNFYAQVDGYRFTIEMLMDAAEAARLLSE